MRPSLPIIVRRKAGVPYHTAALTAYENSSPHLANVQQSKIRIAAVPFSNSQYGKCGIIQDDKRRKRE
jgi:hypothetical protein